MSNCRRKTSAKARQKSPPRRGGAIFVSCIIETFSVHTHNNHKLLIEGNDWSVYINIDQMGKACKFLEKACIDLMEFKPFITWDE